MPGRVLLLVGLFTLVLGNGAQAQQARVTAEYDVVRPALLASPTFAAHRASVGVPEASQADFAARALRQSRTRKWEGAAVGAVVLGVATYAFLHSGGSTSLCDRERNQDAIRRNECNAIVAGGAVAGAGVGYLVGSRIRVGSR